MVTITYIHHSCFLVNSPECRILFDFWKDPGARFSDIMEEDKEKPLYIMVSHSHKDHYNPDIFKWAEKRDNIRFILSKDTAKRARHFFSPTSTHRGPHIDPSMLTVMEEGDIYTDDFLTIHAFGSTDVGNSYLVETAALRFFHAGDLNAWIWKDESTKKEVKEAIDLFRLKIDPIKHLLSKEGEEEAIDVAMFPVDSRIGTEYWTGAKIFLEELPVRFFLPMHFGLVDKEEQALRAMDAICFGEYANPDYPTVFVGPLQHFGELGIPSPGSSRRKTERQPCDISSDGIEL